MAQRASRSAAGDRRGGGERRPRGQEGQQRRACCGAGPVGAEGHGARAAPAAVAAVAAARGVPPHGDEVHEGGGLEEERGGHKSPARGTDH
ncbi:unnamed protein product [Lampetra fluviatilis]